MTTLSSGLPPGSSSGPSVGPSARLGTGPRSRPTMRDVAALAGVSLKTVSRVINDEPGVSPALVERVRVAADTLGFVPNPAASALRRSDGRTATLGVLLEDIGNPFFSAVHRGIEETARAHDVAVFSSSTDLDLDRERHMTAVYSARRVDALITAPTEGDHSHLEQIVADGVRLVLVDRPAIGLSARTVITDNREGSRAGVAHLLAHGHRRVAFLGRDPSIYTARERFAGYADALGQAGIAVDPTLISREGSTRSSAERQVEGLLDRSEPPTALFAAQNLITMAAVTVLRRRGLQNQVALVGFDDFEMADLLDPPVTVVAQDPHRIGQLSAELALGLRSEDAVTVVPTTLIARGSGEVPPADAS